MHCESVSVQNYYKSRLAELAKSQAPPVCQAAAHFQLRFVAWVGQSTRRAVLPSRGIRVLQLSSNRVTTDTGTI